MEKRSIIFGSYDTAKRGWTLTGWKFSDPEQKTNYVEKPGGDGALDLSTALTDGIPRYHDRTLTATFECSDGTRLAREEEVCYMVNQLDGMLMNITLPDDTTHYITGRVHVAVEYNDPAHAAVSVTAICEPWKYSVTERANTLSVSTNKKTATFYNNGRRTVVPQITVSGTSANVVLSYESASLTLSEGTYKWPTFLLTPGSHNLSYSGTGTLKISYREAVLR